MALLEAGPTTPIRFTDLDRVPRYAVAEVELGGTNCGPSAVNAMVSTVRGRIWPRISLD